MTTAGPFAAGAHPLRERGLAVIPCPVGKSPKGAYKFEEWKWAPGASFVDDMIRRHGEANIAIITGLSDRKLSVVDVDDPSEAMHVEMGRRFGDTPLATVTPSGGIHLWYQFNGERPTNLRGSEGIPVEVKTAASKLLVVVPPSRSAKTGEPYFLIGSWDHLGLLPPIKPDAVPLLEEPRRSPGGAHQRAELIREGRRGDELWRYCMRQAKHCDDLDALTEVAKTFAGENMDLIGGHPFTDDEIVGRAVSAWNYETTGRNLFGRGGALIVGHELVDQLAAQEPDAYALYSILQRHHGVNLDEFVLANAMADHLGWTLRRFRAAIVALTEYGLIRCTHRGGQGTGDPRRYRWV